jgi:hypothetical protein
VILLIIPCEIVVKSVVPAVKALVVKELVEKYNLRQEEVAKLLGISQSAVSKYTRNVRGYVINVEGVDEVKPTLQKIIQLVLNGEYSVVEFLRLFCNMCNLIREKGFMCDFCRKTDKKLQFEECNFCLR